jgi:colanic acid/amylovoran biosynthesis glycosyltransferase
VLSETFILSQIVGLLERGHEVVILADAASSDEKVHGIVETYRLREKAVYLPHIPSSKARCLGRALVLVVWYFFRYPFPMLRFVGLFLSRQRGLSLKVLYNLLTICRYSPDVLFCHYGPNGQIGAMLKAAFPGLKLVTMFHGYDIRLGIEKGPLFYQELFRKADLLLANSRFTRDWLLKWGADSSRVKIHPVGVDVKAFCAKQQTDYRKREDIVLLSVGRLAEEKGFEYALQAVKILQERNPSQKLIYQIVGAGPQERYLKELAVQLSLGDSVQFLGAADQEEIIEKMHQADVFVLPSVSEGLGLVLLEAQAAGVPVVATNVGGIPEAVEEGQTGFLVPPRDAAALADKIQFLMEHPDIREKMGENGRRRVETYFEIHELNNRLESYLLELINR